MNDGTKLGRAGLVAAFLGILTGQSHAWLTQIDGTLHSEDKALAVALTGSGEIVAVGSTDNSLTVVKIAGFSGAEVWRQILGGGWHCSEGECMGAVDDAGDVVAAGRLSDDLAVLKLSGESGSVLWQRTMSPGAPFALAIDSHGDVIVAGVRSGLSVVVKVSGVDGTVLWEREVGPGSARAVVTDFGGDVIAAGEIQVDGCSEPSFAVWKLSGASGSDIWLHTTGCNRGMAWSVAVDDTGGVAAAGFTEAPASDDRFTVVRLSDAGEQLWLQVIDGTGPGRAQAVAMDPAGHVIAAGYIVNASMASFAVVKLSGFDGTEFWRKINGPGNGSEVKAMTVDTAGDVVAAGSIRGVPLDPDGSSTNAEFALVKLSGLTGDEIWRYVLEVPGDEEALDVAVDESGHAVAVGYGQEPNTYSGFPDFLVVKRRGSDGTDFPCDDEACSCLHAKAKATGTTAFELLKAFGRNVRKQNQARLISDISKAQSKLTKAFTKAEFTRKGAAKGCLTTGDVDAIEAKAEAFVVDIIADVVGSPSGAFLDVVPRALD